MTTNNIVNEAAEQQGFLIWFKNKFPNVLIYHVPNGEKRAMSVAVRLKRLGVVRGIPDLVIPAWHVYLEMKRATGGTVSPEQKKIMEYLTRHGYTCIVGYGATDASRKILKFLEEQNGNTKPKTQPHF